MSVRTDVGNEAGSRANTHCYTVNCLGGAWEPTSAVLVGQVGFAYCFAQYVRPPGKGLWSLAYRLTPVKQIRGIS